MGFYFEKTPRRRKFASYRFHIATSGALAEQPAPKVAAVIPGRAAILSGY
jgi:hypothetical protein